MKIECCDECGAVFGNIENGQVLRVSMTIFIDNGQLSAISPVANHKMSFCSAACALDYLNKFKKVEDEWLENWKNSGILGKKKFIPSNIRGL